MAHVLKLDARDRVLVFAPHPDDETIAAGGLLQQAHARRAAVRVVFATDGDNNPWAQRAVEHRWRIGERDRARFGARRRREALAALARLGIGARDAQFLGYHDQGLTALLMSGSEAPLARLAQSIAAFRPTTIVAPSPADLHPDHSALAVLVDFALAWLSPHAPAARIIHYVVHDQRSESDPAARPPLVVALGHRERLRKRQAMFAHGTQLVLRRRALLTRAGEPETFVLAAQSTDDRRDHADPTDVDGRVWLSLRRSLRVGACGATALLVVCDGPQARRFQGRLGRRDGIVHLRDVAGGGYDLAVAVHPSTHRVEIGIPAAVFAGARRAYVKLERRFGFFDEAGWHPLTLVAARARDVASATSTRARRIS